MEQIINLYLDRVVVFPDYVEIHLNNVPTNLLNPSEAKDEPALGGLHTFYIEKMSDNILPKYQTGKSGQYGYDILVKLHRKDEKKNKSRQKGHNETQAQIGLGLCRMVEPRGIEPLSESNLERTSPGAVCYLHSLSPAGTNTLRESVASSCVVWAKLTIRTFSA